MIEIKLREYNVLGNSVVMIKMNDRQLNIVRYLIVYIMEFVGGFKEPRVIEINEVQYLYYIEKYRKLETRIQVENTYKDGKVINAVRYLYQWVPYNEIDIENEKHTVNKYKGWIETFQKEEVSLFVLEPLSTDTYPILIDLNKVEVVSYNSTLLSQGISLRGVGEMKSSQRGEEESTVFSLPIGLECVLLNNGIITKKTDNVIKYNLAHQWVLKTDGVFKDGDKDNSKQLIVKLGNPRNLTLQGFSNSLGEQLYGADLLRFDKDTVKKEVFKESFIVGEEIRNITYEEAVRIANTEEGNHCKAFR